MTFGMHLYDFGPLYRCTSDIQVGGDGGVNPDTDDLGVRGDV